MKRWDVWDQHGEWLGTIHGTDEADALVNARIENMITAAHATLRLEVA